MQKRMTITMDEAVYEGLVRVVGRRKISGFLESLARPHVVTDDLAEGYKAMGQDQQREQEALAWSEALIGDSKGSASHEAR
jgi:hypothetical protein